jgi:small-conductance mechanosensitive channel
MWVQSRQYSRRIVTISNSEIFEQPVYNYTRDFPYIWEEMHLPVSYKDDRDRAEQIMFDSVLHHTTEIANIAQPELDRLISSFSSKPLKFAPAFICSEAIFSQLGGPDVWEWLIALISPRKSCDQSFSRVRRAVG